MRKIELVTENYQTYQNDQIKHINSSLVEANKSNANYYKKKITMNLFEDPTKTKNQNVIKRPSTSYGQ